MPIKSKQITVAVTPTHYCEIRMLAAELDTTVTHLVAYLPKRIPGALRPANHPIFRCETVNPCLTQAESTACADIPVPCTAPVRQYATSIQMKTKDLSQLQPDHTEAVRQYPSILSWPAEMAETGTVEIRAEQADLTGAGRTQLEAEKERIRLPITPLFSNMEVWR